MDNLPLIRSKRKFNLSVCELVKKTLKIKKKNSTQSNSIIDGKIILMRESKFVSICSTTLFKKKAKILTYTM